MTAAGPLVLGVDSGGSGLRVALGAVDEAFPVLTAVCDGPVRTGSAGIDAGHLLEQLLPAARRLLEQARRVGDGPGGGAVPPGAEIAAVAIGAAGMATLGGQLRAQVPDALAKALGVRRCALAADAVTAYAGALGQRAGAVVAAGTGMIALGTDLVAWRRADGWGHLLGDCGGGAWIGRAGLEAAMRAYDGRLGGSTALLARAQEVFGPAPELPGLLYPRTDRPAFLASFAPEVAACAADDRVAAGILCEAATHIARAATAVCPGAGTGTPPAAATTPGAATTPAAGAGSAAGARAGEAGGEARQVALTGGLFRMGEPLLAPLREELARQVPQARVVPASGDPLTGSLAIARALASSDLRLPLHPTLLFVPEKG